MTKQKDTSKRKKKRKKDVPTLFLPELPEYIRLNRYIALSGLCSRREADKLIANGLVKVNGEKVTQLGTKVHIKKDVVEVRGKRIKPEPTVYLILNKPKNTITTLRDEKGRITVMDYVRRATNVRIYPVGRLDRNTTGVLLFTNDGELARYLTHPSSEVKKVYAVRVKPDLKEEDYKKICEGVLLEDGIFKPDAFYFNELSDKPEWIIEMHSGRNRVIRRMFAQLGYKVTKLDRIAFAGLTKKGLKRGQWRFLTTKEIGMLKMLVGNLKRKVHAIEDRGGHRE